VFDDKTALLGLNVQKYGRTTKLTKGQITGINGTVTVCYEVFIIFCLKSATYVDQLIIEPGSFSGGGDSGSLIVSDDQNKNPVGLLFAGSSSQTIANRIDLVLNYFGVHVDGSAPPTPLASDIAISSISAPGAVTQGATANVVVTLKNVGTEAVSASFNVTLQEAPVTGHPLPGMWTGKYLNASQCIAGDLGGNGTCIVLVPSLKRGTRFVTFTVTNVTMPGQTYDPSANQDPDGDSKGTSITVRRP